ncbi:MAG: carbohydrate-binding protein [Spirosomataceae bacterium]
MLIACCASASKKLLIWGIVLFSGTLYAQKNYKGKPYKDSLQVLPGKLECEKYDSGGEGIAYHDKDSLNNGSGKLNPNDGTYFNTFRFNEGVDISYTKPRGIDDNPYNEVEPLLNQLYVGWTEPGEWVNYSVEVKEDGYYEGTLMYTANADGKIAIGIDGKSWLGPVVVQSTYNAKDDVAWRQWHHWNKQVIFGSQKLSKGKHVLTLKTVEKGNMNYDFIVFKRVQ